MTCFTVSETAAALSHLSGMSIDDARAEVERLLRETVSPPHWQPTPPNEPGFYWTTRGDVAPCRMVELRQDPHGVQAVRRTGTSLPIGVETLMGYRWWPVPLMPPEVPE